MAALRGERANVTGGKYYCSADLRLKIAPSVPSAATSQDSVSLLPMKTYKLMMNKMEKILLQNQNKNVFSEVTLLGGSKKLHLFSFSSSGQEREVSIWGHVRPQRVFSKSSNPCGIVSGSHSRWTSLTQIHIKVHPAEKEMLGKYILKSSVTSLCCHRGKVGCDHEPGWTMNLVDVWLRPLRRYLRNLRWSQTQAKWRCLTLQFAKDEGTILTSGGSCCREEVAQGRGPELGKVLSYFLNIAGLQTWANWFPSQEQARCAHVFWPGDWSFTCSLRRYTPLLR